MQKKRPDRSQRPVRCSIFPSSTQVPQPNPSNSRAFLSFVPQFVWWCWPLEVSHQSVPGKENAYRRIFLLAEELGAKACCVVGGDALVITPDWIVSLVQPILDMNFDLAAPLYQRDKYDGLLVSGILYPAVRALFGKRIRQPAGSDFGYSRALILRCLSLDTWNTESARRDINFWVSMQAAQEDMKLCQVHLGSRPRVKLDAALEFLKSLKGQPVEVSLSSLAVSCDALRGRSARTRSWPARAASWPRPRSRWSRATWAGRPKRSTRHGRRSRITAIT